MWQGCSPRSELPHRPTLHGLRFSKHALPVPESAVRVQEHIATTQLRAEEIFHRNKQNEYVCASTLKKHRRTKQRRRDPQTSSIKGKNFKRRFEEWCKCTATYHPASRRITENMLRSRFRPLGPKHHAQAVVHGYAPAAVSLPVLKDVRCTAPKESKTFASAQRIHRRLHMVGKTEDAS